MDIPMISMALARQKTLSDVQVSLLSNAMDVQETGAEGLLNIIDSSVMELSVNPDIGANFDIKV